MFISCSGYHTPQHIEDGKRKCVSKFYYSVGFCCLSELIHEYIHFFYYYTVHCVQLSESELSTRTIIRQKLKTIEIMHTYGHDGDTTVRHKTTNLNVRTVNFLISVQRGVVYAKIKPL